MRINLVERSLFDFVNGERCVIVRCTEHPRSETVHEAGLHPPAE
jgi:hypothetical protein